MLHVGGISLTVSKHFPSLSGIKTITKNRYFYIVLIAFVTFTIFWQVIGYEFISYDDDFTIYQNPYVQSVSAPNILHAWTNPYKDSYMPLTITFLAIEGIVAKTTSTQSNSIEFNPAIFHASNLILHIMNSILVMLILKILIKDNLASFFGALIFTLHPVQVESVAWVTGVKDVFSGFLSLVAIWQYLLYAQLSREEIETDQDNRDRNRKIMHYLIAIVSFILAILAKPTRVVVPIIAFTLDYLLLKRRLKQTVVSIIGWIMVSLPVIVATIVLMPSPKETTSGFSLLERLIVTSDSLAFYLYKLVFPISLGPDYGRTIPVAVSQRLFLITPVILALYGIAVYTLKKHRSWLIAFGVIFIAGILPMLGLVRFQFQSVSTVADRYLYLSMLGPALAVSFFLSLYKKHLGMTLCGVLLGIFGILSILQVQNWKNTITLFNHALKVNPASGTFHSYLGIIKSQDGKYDEAIFHFSEALKNHHNLSKVHVNMGNALAQQGKFDDAMYHFSESLKINPNNAEAYASSGYVLAQQGKFSEAILELQQALRLSPNDAEAHTNLGIVFALQGKFNDAVPHFYEALKSDPNNAEAHLNLAVALSHLGKNNEAAFHYSETAKINPGLQKSLNNPTSQNQ